MSFIERTLLIAVLLSVLNTVTPVKEDNEYWVKQAQETLESKILHKSNLGRARNIILFIGDGMGVSTVTAARIYQGQRSGLQGEEYKLSFEKFPYVGLSKTYNIDKQVPDSASTAIAMLTGVKVKYGTLGITADAPAGVCDQNVKFKIDGLATWAQNANKSTGIVTTTTVTDATPAAAYAHVDQRYWECDNKVPNSLRSCRKDIARQLVEDAPGKNFNVILGGGQSVMGASQVEAGSCIRTDGKNLTKDWQKGKMNALYVNSKASLMSADVANVDYLLGLFSPSHFPYVEERSSDIPSLTDMTVQAIHILQKNENGFFLLVEAGHIDKAHHKNLAKASLRETCELDETVVAALSNTDPNETLIIVTADHSHVFTMAGYPKRGSDILGLALADGKDDYETLSYANGPGFWRHTANGTNGDKAWMPLKDMNRSASDYQHKATVYRKMESHGGEDVAVFATGPSAHLLTGCYEQNYIAHVAAYAACIGPSEELCKKHQHTNLAANRGYPNLLLQLSCITMLPRFLLCKFLFC